MKLLVIDTATSTCSVAVTANGLVVAEEILAQEKTLSSRLLMIIEEVCKSAAASVHDMDGVAVTVGPGSFTALRVGVATAKGLALAANKPLVGVSSLAVLAMNLPYAGHAVCTMFDARKSEVYAALYRCTDVAEILVEPCVVPPAEFLDRLKSPTIFVGEGAVRYGELIRSRLGEKAIFAPPHCHIPRAAAGAVLAGPLFEKGATTTPALLNPIYIRPSEAELAKMQRKTEDS